MLNGRFSAYAYPGQQPPLFDEHGFTPRQRAYRALQSEPAPDLGPLTERQVAWLPNFIAQLWDEQAQLFFESREVVDTATEPGFRSWQGRYVERILLPAHVREGRGIIRRTTTELQGDRLRAKSVDEWLLKAQRRYVAALKKHALPAYVPRFTVVVNAAFSQACARISRQPHAISRLSAAVTDDPATVAGLSDFAIARSWLEFRALIGPLGLEPLRRRQIDTAERLGIADECGMVRGDDWAETLRKLSHERAPVIRLELLDNYLDSLPKFGLRSGQPDITGLDFQLRALV